ncbi:MAG: hypothetical protein KGO50_17630 [Myxococcales bacterium]|nr:hypothetical protein [Myxococcales bacterium]
MMNRFVLYLVLTLASLGYVLWFGVQHHEVRWPMLLVVILLAFRTWGYWRQYVTRDA